MSNPIRFTVSNQDSSLTAELTLSPQESLSIVRRLKTTRINRLVHSARSTEENFVAVAKEIHETLRELLAIEDAIVAGQTRDRFIDGKWIR